MAKAKKAAAKPAKKVVKKPAAKVAAKKPVVKKPANGIIADVEHLMQIMAANDVTEIDVADGNRKISLKRGTCVSAPVMTAAPAIVHAHAAPVAAPAAAPVKQAEEVLPEIKSPMVGTFYAAPSPDSDPFVKIGDRVSPDTVVCIVEAMKVMNEIKAEVAGTVVEVCVKNAQGVEFGQTMFKVKP